MANINALNAYNHAVNNHADRANAQQTQNKQNTAAVNNQNQTQNQQNNQNQNNQNMQNNPQLTATVLNLYR